MISTWKATRPDDTPVVLDDLGPDRTIHLATPHGDLDLLSEKVAGISFARLREGADVKRVDGVPAPICSLADLIALKRLAGRERDLADLSDLEAAHGESPKGGP